MLVSGFSHGSSDDSGSPTNTSIRIKSPCAEKPLLEFQAIPLGKATKKHCYLAPRADLHAGMSGATGSVVKLDPRLEISRQGQANIWAVSVVGSACGAICNVGSQGRDSAHMVISVSSRHLNCALGPSAAISAKSQCTGDVPGAALPSNDGPEGEGEDDLPGQTR